MISYPNLRKGRFKHCKTLCWKCCRSSVQAKGVGGDMAVAAW